MLYSTIYILYIYSVISNYMLNAGHQGYQSSAPCREAPRPWEPSLEGKVRKKPRNNRVL